MRIRADAEVEAFLTELRARRVSTSLLDRTERVLPRLLSHLREEGRRSLSAVTEADLASWARVLSRQTTRYGKNPTLTTQALYLAVVRRFFAWLFRQGRTLQDPAKELKLPRPDSLPRVVLTETQARRLMSAPAAVNPRWWAEAVEKRDHAILELLYGTGLRLGECARLDVSDLNLLERRLFVRDGKGHRDRVVPVTGRTLVALDSYSRDVRPLFTREPRERGLFSWRGPVRGCRPSRSVRWSGQEAPAAGPATRLAARAAAQLRDASSSRRRRPALRAGAARASVDRDHHPLHARRDRRSRGRDHTGTSKGARLGTPPSATIPLTGHALPALAET